MHVAYCSQSCDYSIGLADSHMLHVLIGIHVRLCHSNTDHVIAECNVQLGLETTIGLNA